MTTVHHAITKWAAKNGVAIAANSDDTFTFTQSSTGISASGSKASDVRADLEAKIKADGKAVKVLTGDALVKGMVKVRKAAGKAKSKKAAILKGERAEKKTLVTGKSGVMKLPYHTRYMNNGGGTGDDLDISLREAVLKVAKGEKKPTLDVDELRKIAQTHDVWKPEYEDLNPGMQRMNVSNRLRAIGRNGGVVRIKGKVIDIPPRDSDEE